MRRVVLYLAMSLDGFVADQNGKVDWLTPFEGEDTYTDFERTVDTIVMGRRTYAQIVTELSPNQWVYPNQTSYVITHEVCLGTEAVRFVDQDPVTLVDTLKKTRRKRYLDQWWTDDHPASHSGQFDRSVSPDDRTGAFRCWDEIVSVS